ncbi:MAG: ferritin family protein [Nanoarchaeota archaeon]|nr:ferritin family protein [Nanoarchaeota archaeon]MBU1974780.1 ferritin family protein [Nanoarchaeota archaeon]
MNEKLQQILNMAIKEEEFFKNFYLEAAEKTDVESAKALLKNLSEAEASHKERLETLDSEKLGELVIADKIDAIDVAEELALTPINEFNSLKEIFEFAIKAEASAKDMYERLGESVDDETAKKLFTLLASEEEKHHDMLASELEKIGI